MRTQEELYDLFAQKGIPVYHADAVQAPAVTLCARDRYAVFLNPEYLQDSSFENGVLAHEMGHIVTGATHRVDSPTDLVERHEEQAERWAVRLMIPWRELESAVRSGKRTVWELAEHFNVPEKMVRKALDYYALRGHHFQFKGETE